MTIMQGFWLGIVQGISEFLPISSSGHLVLLQRLFGIESNLFSLTIVVHVGSLVPVVVIYFSRLRALLFQPFQKMTLLLLAGTLPMVLMALLLDDLLEVLFGGGFLGIGFLMTGLLMLVVDRLVAGAKDETAITTRDAVLIGFAQAIASMVPGISRSGSTIFGGVCRGLDRQTAADFSFLLSVPAIMGATAWELMGQLGGDGLATDFLLTPPVMVAFVASMVAGFFAIKVMLRLMLATKMNYFAYYLFVLAGLIGFDQLVTGIFF